MKHYHSLHIESYLVQEQHWPQEGQHILAQYDDESIIVYQAYRPAIGLFAIEHQYFGGEFSLRRMSWIKPNFLWMMYRSNWGRTPGQEIVLAIRLRRTFFDKVVACAVPSSYEPDLFASKAQWQTAVQQSDVRLQWDPNHDPDGKKCVRRAIQLGLRGAMLEEYSRAAILEILDMREFIHAQRQHVMDTSRLLYTPRETIYLPIA